MKKLSRENLVQQLGKEGLKFSELVLVSEGDYAADDSDWNYKDIPHLHHVHELAEACPAVIGDDLICSINLQSILGIWVPIALVNYEYAKYRQVYFTTLLFFALVIETRTEELAPLRTRVTTTYSIGHPKWLFFAVPLIKALIRKNYKVLMATDIPMRDRRGALRKLGYSFVREGESYGFAGTVDVSGTHVRIPPGAARTVQCDYKESLAQSDRAFVGDIGLLGFRLVKTGDEVMIFPRACPHEGASLDRADCSAGAVRCEWHGRRIGPIGKFTWGQHTAFTNGDYSVRVEDGRLSVKYIGAETHTGHAA